MKGSNEQLRSMVSKIQKKIIYIGGGAGMIGMLLLLLPIWNVEQITIEQINHYTQEEILDSSKLQKGMHALSISKSKTEEKLMQLPYIEDAKVEVDLPNQVRVIIKENLPIGYVPFNGTYLCLSNEGKILTQSNQVDMELPIIEGIKFEQFKIGEKVLLEDEEKFVLAVEIIKILREYDFLDEIESIDLSNIQEIHLYVNKLDVIIGNMREFDKKIMWLKEVHKNYTMGILDLSMIHLGQAILTPLT